MKGLCPKCGKTHANRNERYFDMNEKQREAAEKFAREQGCHGPLHHVEDVWGGYWQTASSSGVYNFRLETDCTKQSPTVPPAPARAT